MSKGKSANPESALNKSQLTKLICSQIDFQQSLSSLTFLLESTDYTAKYSKVELLRLRCFETTCLISLSRGLDLWRERGRLNFDLININPSKEESDLLDLVKNLRDRVIAHSDKKEMHFQAVSFQAMEDHDFKFLAVSSFIGLELSLEHVLAIDQFIRKVINALEKRLTVEVRRIPEDFRFSKTAQRFERRGMSDE